MTFYVLSLHSTGDTSVTPFPDMEQAIDFMESIGGWEDGKRFIAVPMVRTIQYHEPVPCIVCGDDVRVCTCLPF